MSSYESQVIKIKHRLFLVSLEIRELQPKIRWLLHGIVSVKNCIILWKLQSPTLNNKTQGVILARPYRLMTLPNIITIESETVDQICDFFMFRVEVNLIRWKRTVKIPGSLWQCNALTKPSSLQAREFHGLAQVHVLWHSPAILTPAQSSISIVNSTF